MLERHRSFFLSCSAPCMDKELPSGSPGLANTQTQLAGNNLLCVYVCVYVCCFTFMTDSLPAQCEKNEKTYRTL